MNTNPRNCSGFVPPTNMVATWTSSPKFIDGKLNTSEFVYKLNLPPIEERFNEYGNQLLDISKPMSMYTDYPVSKVFKPDWIKWHGIEWIDVVRFYKDNYIGRIHDDGHHDKWGINWVVSGYATASFWNLSKIDSIQRVHDERDKPINIYKTSQLPCKHYVMPPGVYLFNAGLPHLPAGYNKRLVFSLRSKNMPWEKVVNHFSEFIE